MKKCTTKLQRVQSSIGNFRLAPMNPCVAGIDIGSRSVFICIGFTDGHQEIREYLTFTEDLGNMLDWIKDNGIQSVAMESTGVYWIPVYDILAQGGIDVTLVNPHYLKTVPGRKTDVKDCQWIQQLHAYGLLSGFFRPDDEEVTLRGYIRQRSRLFELAAQQVQLMHKALVQMNLQLNHVISDITGTTGMNIIRSIVAGERAPSTLAKFRDPRCKKSEKEIAKALHGNYREEHLLALKHALESYDALHKQSLECEEAIERTLKKWEQEDSAKGGPTQGPTEDCETGRPTHGPAMEHTVKNKRGVQKKTAYNRSPYDFEAEDVLKRILGVNLLEIPGIDVNGAMKIIAEIGRNISKWPSAKHFASWLGLCPGNKVSGGKILSSRTKPTANRASQALRMAANSLYRSKTALGAYFRRMRAKLGAPKAITATAHKLARILYKMLKEQITFQEAGQEAYENEYKERQLKSLQKRAEELGYQLVTC